MPEASIGWIAIIKWIGWIAIIKWIWIKMKRRFSYMAENSQDNQVLGDLDASASLPSSSSKSEWKYDVFLSFRGPDTRKGITVDIYDGLSRRGIRTFMDDPDLQVGDAISPTLIAAIKESRFAIVILSQNYASSAWCLEELREICECMQDHRILPLFYHVDPTDVRFQKHSFGEAFTHHETSGRHKSEKVKQWRDALNKVANFSGWYTQQYKTHRELVKVIVEYVCTKVVPVAIESTGDFQEFGATRRAMLEVNEALKNDEITTIGVYGMGGVGKTTLVEHVGAQARTSGIFDYVTKCVVSQNPDLKNLQDTLAEQLGFRLHENTEIARAARLSKEIKRRGKILLILDDIWEGLDLSRIGIPTYKELQNCKSKVLLTTRIRNVCHQMECQRKITLNILSEQDSWALFARKASRSFESATFEDVAKKVAKECKGLPIALITVARALGDKDLAEWKRAAQRLMKSQTANPDDQGEVSQCINLSFDYLKDEEYKSYFLLCCLFPKDCDIPIEELFRYAIGKGLFRDADTLQQARERAESLARQLQYSGLLLDTRNNNFVRMQDSVRDAAIQIAQSEEGFLVIAGCGLEDLPRQLHGFSVISLMRNQIGKLPEKLVCSKLQILLLNYNPCIEEIPEAFFHSPNELRVLDLSWTSISLLSQSFNLLTNLKALFLDKCDITDSSILGKLKRLEILSMRDTHLKELSIEVGGLTNLRMLDNSGGHIARIPPKVISKLHSLEELYIQGFREWGSKVQGAKGETNAGFDEVTSLSKLRVLKVTISDAECLPKYVKFIPNWVEFDISIGGLYKSHLMKLYERCPDTSIYLELDMISRLPKWFCNEIMKISLKLRWHGCQRLIDIFVESEHGRLQKLKHLHIMGSESRSITEVDLTISWVPKSPVFENLEELYLEGLDSSELCAIECLPPGSLFNLKVLHVVFCYNWGNILLPSTLLRRLPNLEELLFQSTDGGKHMFGYEALLLLPQLKLKKIRLSYLATARICVGPAPPVMFQDLQNLSITDCMLEGSLFTYDVALCLSQLNCLRVHNCPLLELIVEASNKKTTLAKLKQLSLMELPMLYYESATFDIECPSLERFFLKNCPKFSASSSDFHSRKQVQLGWFEKAPATSGPSSSNHQIISKPIQFDSRPSISSSLPSSSAAATRWRYDVFLSFRGPDTRKGITVDIRDRLQSRGIKTFMDDPDLQRGDTISPALIAAIQESRFAVVVLSQNYASSTWCLEELVKICECMANENRIFPLFFDVDPSDVRYQKGNFKEAFSKHEDSGRHELEMVKQWRAALHRVANISGWNTKNFKTHKELVDDIVESLRSKVPPDAIESADDFQAYEATTLAMDEVKEALRDDGITAVGVYGMGGVGKTTMVTHVAAQACINGTFSHFIKASISQSPDLSQIQDTLADLLGVQSKEKTEAGRAATLHQQVMRREKLLIILDDVWDRIELSKIGIPNSKELQTVSSKVLVTTRRRNVCHVMGCQKITLNTLSTEDSWAFFVRKARRSFERREFVDVAKKVAGECGGLPIALQAVARALGDKDLKEWKRAAKRLEKSQTANPDDDQKASKCIRLSYDHLKDKDYKSYFLLCCLFPEDSFIPTEKLFMYAIGKGLFRDAETLEEARENAGSVATHLVDSCLLLENSGDDTYVRMHDVIRDTALQIAESEDGHGFLVKAGSRLKDWPRQVHEGYTAISLMRSHMSKLPQNLVCPKLQILLLNGNSNLKEIPETFIQSPYELKVLDLSWTSISSIPQSFSLLTNLQALYLDNCHGLNLVTDYSILGNLKKLEILSIRKSVVKEWSREIGGLTNLRMLDHSGGLIARIPSTMISKWENLEELYIPGFWLWGAEVKGERKENNAGFDEVTSLSKLRALKVSMFDAECIPKYVESIPDWDEFDIRIGRYDPVKIQSQDESDRYGHVNSICMKLDIISRLPDWFRNEIMKKTEHLVWEEGRRLIDIFVESEHGRLQRLKQLEIVGPEGIMEPWNTVTWVPKNSVFENLEVLHLVELDCAELCALEVLPPGSLFNLKLLKVETCYNWGNILLPTTLLWRLLNLEELCCNTMYQSDYVFGYEEKLKLRKIELSDVGIISICDGPAPPAMFQTLQSLSITNCMLLGSLFTYDVAQCLPQLNYLVLEKCHLLERIVEASNRKTILSKLEKLSLIELPKLDYESASFDIECPSLEYLELCDCPKFSVSSSDFHSGKQVQLKLDRSYKL